jgi:PEGA domain
MACSGEPAAPPPVPAPAPDDASPGITEIGKFDPASGAHLDDDGASAHAPPARRAIRNAPAIAVTLRSTPPGATVYVDGESLGETPELWAGLADGNAHEFAFIRRGYALARYRFVPVSSGVLHATLERVAGDAPSVKLEPRGGAIGRPRQPPAKEPAIAPPPAVLEAPVDDAAPSPGAASDAAPASGPQP